MGNIGGHRHLYLCRKPIYKKLNKGALQGPLGYIGRQRDFLWDYFGGPCWQRYSKEWFGDIGGYFFM